MATLGAAVCAAGCANFDLARASHDILQTAQCEKNEPRGSCNRDWGDEYDTWQAQRSEYLSALQEEKEAAAANGWLQPVDTTRLPEL